MSELEKLVETLWFDVSDECVPCECGIKCPFYDYSKEDNTYCREANCTTAIALLIEKIVKTSSL